VLSLSAFTDVGQVSPDWHSLRTSDMKAGYGVGVALHSPTQTILRADVATGAGEGWQFFVSLRPRF
jgi:outer membrane translocation and assembly module TamA